MNFKFLLIWVFTLVIVLISCDDTININDIDSVVIPDKNVSFGKYIQPLIYTKCSSIDGCHGNGDYGQQGGVLLTNWDTITEYVVPGDAEISELGLIVDGSKLHQYTIPDILKLNDNQKQGIITWINEGAQNN